MRDLATVISAMMQHVPDGHALRIGFADVLDSIPYTAPEAITLRWQSTFELLAAHIGDKPTEPWQWEVISVFSTKPVDILKIEMGG